MKKLIIISILGFFCLKVSAQGTVNGHEYVDLGLSVKWATCNVGADSPEEYGTYFDYDNALAVPKSWGENFRLPTNNEFYELINSCTWTWIKQNDVDGYKITGPNGSSIFLPAAGYYKTLEFDEELLDSENIILPNADSDFQDVMVFGSDGVSGCYWSSTLHYKYVFEYLAHSLRIDSADRRMDYEFRDIRFFTIRPVIE